MAKDIERRLAKLERLLEERHPKIDKPPIPAPPLHRVQSAWKDAPAEDRMNIVAWIQDQLRADQELLDSVSS